MVNINQKMVNVLGGINLNASISIHALAKKVDEPYTSIYRQITKLNKFGVIKLNRQGQVNFVSLNLKNELTRHLLSVVSYFKKEKLVNKHPLLKIVAKQFGFNSPLIVFGSYVSGKRRKHSDLDLCVLGLSTKQERLFKSSLKKIELIHKIEINCLFFRKNEFVSMLKSNSHNVGKEIFLNHLVLKNSDLWYYLVNEVDDEIRL
ncbi:nucleotidyltransferase domain-containing protein [Candidatus Woesearchaeota archaeon]|jgi:predicted nucleotidyltransferase|nr:nucleotidyltransferase domain-containing protein [Candidatus Woesearchaeota archaeon]MBT5739507.1 nucleotidyltransferase domain-containing protein [Candidatus Woesearchaeota archaeon]